MKKHDFSASMDLHKENYENEEGEIKGRPKNTQEILHKTKRERNYTDMGSFDWRVEDDDDDSQRPSSSPPPLHSISSTDPLFISQQQFLDYTNKISTSSFVISLLSLHPLSFHLTLSPLLSFSSS